MAVTLEKSLLWEEDPPEDMGWLASFVEGGEGGAEETRPQRIKRSMTQVERDTMNTCLEEVEREAKSKKEKGLSTMNFFLGVSNCFFVTYCFGAIPESFWLVYVFEIMVLFPLRFRNQARARPLKQNYYWADFCWVANFSGLAFLVWIFLDKCGIVPMIDWVRMAIFAACWGVGAGVLLLAAAFLGNALIFHDADNVASVLIHLFPSLVLYTLRWDNERVHSAWPEFHLDYLPFITAKEIFGWSMAFYGAWFVLYTIWLTCFGMNLPKRGYDTIFHCNMRGAMGKVIFAKFKGLGREAHKIAAASNEFSRVDALIYMLAHAICSSLAFLTSILCFKWNVWHAGMNIATTAIVIYNGAERYNYYVTHLYTKKLQDLVNKT